LDSESFLVDLAASYTVEPPRLTVTIGEQKTPQRNRQAQCEVTDLGGNL
jgi:hypothetical protein